MAEEARSGFAGPQIRKLERRPPVNIEIQPLKIYTESMCIHAKE